MQLPQTGRWCVAQRFGLLVSDRFIVRGKMSGTPVDEFLGMIPNGKSFEIMTIDIHTVADGKIVETFHVEDFAGAFRQMLAP